MSDGPSPAEPSDSALFPAPSPSSVNDLTLTRERQKAPINEFLEQLHPLGGVTGWKACFSGRYRDSIVAVVVLSRPVSANNDDGASISITRFCRRDDRPANTGSWLIARARQWAYLEGYDRLLTHAGVAGNYGTVYEAAGFECDRESTAVAGEWQYRDGRKDYGEFDRRRWVYNLRETADNSNGGETDD